MIVSAGDDGLTQSLVAAVTDQFQKSPDFRLASANGLAVVSVTVPHVDWKPVLWRTRVRYRVSIERANTVLAEAKGECWEHNVRVCAQQIVNTTATAVGGE